VPSISVDFLNGRVLVAKSQRIVDEVNNALGFLNIILKHEIYKEHENEVLYEMRTPNGRRYVVLSEMWRKI